MSSRATFVPVIKNPNSLPGTGAQGRRRRLTCVVLVAVKIIHNTTAGCDLHIRLVDFFCFDFSHCTEPDFFFPRHQRRFVFSRFFLPRRSDCSWDITTTNALVLQRSPKETGIHTVSQGDGYSYRSSNRRLFSYACVRWAAAYLSHVVSGAHDPYVHVSDVFGWLCTERFESPHESYVLRLVGVADGDRTA